MRTVRRGHVLSPRTFQKNGKFLNNAAYRPSSYSYCFSSVINYFTSGFGGYPKGVSDHIILCRWSKTILSRTRVAFYCSSIRSHAFHLTSECNNVGSNRGSNAFVIRTGDTTYDFLFGISNTQYLMLYNMYGCRLLQTVPNSEKRPI